MVRMGMMIGLRADRVADYRALHAAPWPEMNAALTAANIRNYSIFLKEPENLLFGYWEYVGADYRADMAWLGAQEVTRRWLSLTSPCQMPLGPVGKGEWWSFLPEVFHLP